MVNFFRFNSIALAATLLAASLPIGAAEKLEEVIVEADFRQQASSQLPVSLTLIDQDLINARNATHLESILGAAANTNFSAGASRGRFIQLRGIGERSQFVDPVNPSVGLMVDGIDYSGLGGAATLFDIDQVEILRGPQGTAFGNSALAGILYLTSAAPTEEFEGSLQEGIGNYDSWNLGVTLSGPFSDTLLGRMAVQQHKSDGYIENAYLNRDDTNNQDELTLKAGLHWLTNDQTTVDLKLLHLDINNGYDAFSLDNNRTTLSDEPGEDSLDSSAAALKVHHDNLHYALETTLTWQTNRSGYGYDEDWAYAGIHPWEYQSTDQYDRERDQWTLDLRLLSTQNSKLFSGNSDWLVGFYVEQQDEGLNRVYTYGDVPLFTSSSTMDSLALYGQLDTQLSERLQLTTGIRVERFNHDYSDNIDITSDVSSTLVGGQISLEYQLADNAMLYGQISRGYKAGSVNANALSKALLRNWSSDLVTFLEQRLDFDDESLINYELGYKARYLDNRLNTRLSLFYMDRRDMQLKAWVVDGIQFAGYIDNVGKGNNYGLEWETDWQLTDNFRLSASLGLLETRLASSFLVDDVDQGLTDKNGREQAHAPSYQFSLSGLYRYDHYFARLDIEGKDRFYYSNSHDAQSDPYQLVHLSLGYEQNAYKLTLWSRNLLDETYTVRGFRFGNDPRDYYATHTYEQFGEPRTFGISGELYF